jgi:HD-GYP domain-containing protein (c-di-GMP phosphodiesterase class II)
MIASTQFGGYTRRGTAEEALARVPEVAFGDTDWVRRAVQACAEYLKPAIASGKAYRIANAVRAVTHTPSSQQLDAVIGAVCDSLLAEAYAGRNGRMIGNLADARHVIDEVLADVRDRDLRAAADPGRHRELVDGYVRLVALHDACLAERLDATGTLAARIAGSLKLSPALVLDVELAGRLSDVGMINVPSTRAKRDLPSKREGRRRSRHVERSAAFVQTLPVLSHLAAIVRSHHERYDGSGYPDGLRGDEIPLESRIIGVAAAFTDRVMAGTRAEALPPDEACSELASGAGSAFDPAVVTATLHLLQFRRRTNRSA